MLIPIHHLSNFSAEQRIPVRRPAPVEIPPWVDRAGLADTYRVEARREDEFAAAKLCRRLKQQAEGR